MASVVLSIDYLINLKQHLKIILANLHQLELTEYEVGRSEILQCQINTLDCLLDGIRKITNNPEAFSLK